MCNLGLHIVGRRAIIGCTSRPEEQPMADIRHRVVIDAPASEVYEAIAKPEGVATWWTRDARGAATAGGEIEFWFGGDKPAAVMQLVELTAPRRVVWRCDQGP